MADLTMLTGQKTTATVTFDHAPTEPIVWNVTGGGPSVTFSPGTPADGGHGAIDILSGTDAATLTVTASANGVTVTKTIDVQARVILPTTGDISFSTPIDA